jgi:hypothetical protein
MRTRTSRVAPSAGTRLVQPTRAVRSPRGRSWAGRAAVALALLLLGYRVVWAHDASSPLTMVVDLERTRVGVYLRYAVDRGEAARAAREQFDRDADGRLDDGERARLTAWLAARAQANVTLAVDGQPLTLTVRSVDADLEDGADARVAVVVRLVGKVRWRAGTTSLRIAAELPEPRAVTPVAVRPGRDAGIVLQGGFVGGVASAGAPLDVVVATAPSRRTAR